METYAVNQQAWQEFDSLLSQEPKAKSIIESRIGDGISSRGKFVLIDVEAELFGELEYIYNHFPNLKAAASNVYQKIFCVATEGMEPCEKALEQEKCIWD